MGKQSSGSPPLLCIAFCALSSIVADVYLLTSLLPAEEDSEDTTALSALLVSFLRGFVFLSLLAAASGLYTLHHESLPCLRFFSIQQLFEVSVYTIGLISFGALASSDKISTILGRNICIAITTSSHSDVHDWTLSILDGLENCEERWKLLGVFALLIACLGLIFKAHSLVLIWTHYRFLLKKQAVLGKAIPLDVIGPSCDVESRPSFKRVRSHTFAHSRQISDHRLVLLQSPFTLSPPSSPSSSTPHSERSRRLTIDGDKLFRCQKRAAHQSQNSETYTIAYAPFLVPSSSCSLSPTIITDSPSCSPRSVSPSASDQRTAFPLFKLTKQISPTLSSVNEKQS